MTLIEARDIAENTDSCPICGQHLFRFDLHPFKGGTLLKCLCGFKTSPYALFRAAQHGFGFKLNRIYLGRYEKEPPF